ncbi:unnamed protein product [Allacma fusca]|uniref:CRAL-TRIO domain-containing protein n=1 Tax=Allacma fusca TaxID=39272 RepID=A0A8J2KWQ2_9HEXA|nr:unnamed protein product [Allacma fusca]
MDPDLAACFPVFLDGKTKTGFHVVTVHPGKFKHSSTIQKYGPERVLHYWIQILAKTHKVTFDLSVEAVRLKKFKGDIYSLPLIQKHLSIVDFNEMHFSDFLSGSVLSIYLAVVKMIVKNFQFLDGVIILINAGKTAEIFLKLLRPLLRGSNLELVVFGSNEDEWKPFILKYVDPSEIRPDFGGCKKD